MRRIEDQLEAINRSAVKIAREAAGDVVYVAGAVGPTGVAFGTLSSTAQNGVTLSATNNEILEIYADDGNATLGNAVYSTIRSRTMLLSLLGSIWTSLAR